MAYSLDEYGLTQKQRIFCDEYLIELSVTKAAIKAGYSEKTAYAIGSENLSKPAVSTYLKKRLEEIKNETGVTQKRVIEEYAKIAFFDIRELYTVDGALKAPNELDNNAAGAIAGLESYEERVSDPDSDEKIVVGTTKKVKLNDKIRALDALGRHLGIFEKDNKQREIQIPVINVHNGD